MKNRYLYIVLLCLTAISCTSKKYEPEITAGEIDPSVFVAIGGDRIAGYTDDALSRNGQFNSLGAILAEKLKEVGGGEYIQPLIGNMDLGINLNNGAQLIMGYKTDCNNETSLSPVRASAQGAVSAWNDNLYPSLGPFNNFGIPGISIEDLHSGASNPFFNRFRSQPTTPISTDLIGRNPTFILSDLGYDNIMSYALSGGTSNPIPPANGASSFNESYNTLLSGLAATTKGVLCNIPDITKFPYFTLVPYNGLKLDSANASTLNQVYNPLGIYFEEGDNPFTVSDSSQPFGVRKLMEGELILLSIPLDSVKCMGMGSIVPIPNKYVLSLDEIAEIQSKIAEYNQVIESLGAINNFAVADFNSVFNSLSLGTIIEGVSFTDEFVSGGFFSLDGRNPTAKGMAILTNECLRVANKKYNARIPYASVNQYNGVLFP